ncbi:hypothetical protein Taro_026995 [Colocasia esculenta]|uniref:proline dehydrogenase n=1 Tax=Colocasia esculenta TaxID=4460 RepID=A0A843VQA5_COLES|nr:hypothetical protein [Colocasia esculenta]
MGTLLRSLVNLYAMSCEPVVDLGIAVMRSRVLERSAMARAVVMAAVKETAYRQFCAGEGVEEAGRTLQGLWDEGLRGILDYSLEDAEDNAGCDANLAQFLKTVELTSRLPPSSVSFACVKITAICPVALLERVSDLLRWEQKDPSTVLPWRRHSWPVLSDSSPLYHTPSAPPPLSPTEEHDLQLAHQRLSALCAKCAEFNLPLLIDAEYTSVQPAIDYVSFDAAASFNRGSDPLVYGTMQAYLRDAKDRLALAMEASDGEGIPMGFKLVRGAYMTREARVADSLGAESPVHCGIQETHACYNQCASFMLERVSQGSGSVVLATHNLDSGRMAAAKAEELGLSKGNQRVQFAQLKGMAEGLTLGLRNAGFNVSKYLPFGPVDKVMPYLVRRAEENRGLLSASSLDRQLMGTARSILSVTPTPSSTPAAVLPQLVVKPDAGAQVFDFDDTQRLFATVPSRTLLRSMAVQYAMACEPVMDLGIAFMRSGVMERSSMARAVVMAAAKETVYRHFCAGEGVEEAGRTLQGMWDEGIQGILDYSLEDAVDNAGCDANLTEFLKTVETTSFLPPSSVSFACVKITAICPVTLLERVSDLLRWEQKDPSSVLPWRRHSLPVLSDSSPLYHTPSAPPPLSSKEEHDLQLAHQRLATLCARCAEFNLPLLIDAEYVSVQPAIDYFSYDAAASFNRGSDPLVYGTIQAYLRDAKDRLLLATEAADREGITMGFKLVRGAYMTREAKEAASLGAASPIQPSIQDTHACYNQCASLMLERASRGAGSIVLATHNVESGRTAASKVEELGMGKGSRRVQFAQLKGMAEGLSLGLRNAGFNVSKYLPFGPVDKVVPYLVRRAEENRGLLSTTSSDRKLMTRELKRRLACALLG